MLNCERQINDLHNRLYFITNMSQKLFCTHLHKFLFIFIFLFSFANLFNSTHFIFILLLFYLSSFLFLLLKINTIESGAGVLGKGGLVTVYCDGKPLDLLVDRFILEELDQVSIKLQNFTKWDFQTKLNFSFAGFFIFISFIITHFHSTP